MADSTLPPGGKAERLAREAEGYFELELWPEALARAEALDREGLIPEAAGRLRAECLRNLGRFAEAIPVYERILADRPADSGAWVGLGWCRKRTGRLDLAVAAMESLVAACPGEPIGSYNLACYLSLAGEPERAVQCLERAIAMAPDFRRLAREESDFDPLRSDPAFRKLTEEEA
ncbi:MAG: tetratricopeptide repeat protein [Planctomycetes bacterium]|jgi:Flp pilus assembly protein TadD|nr:tetratricopeptide repeat protein [Planctomycetota bacterium]